MRFEWDETKARANARKHGVTFDEAESVFYDDHALLLDDPDHSAAEDRFVLLGLSAKPRILVAVHCYRDAANTIRLISARRPTASERSRYAERWKR